MSLTSTVRANISQTQTNLTGIRVAQAPAADTLPSFPSLESLKIQPQLVWKLRDKRNQLLEKYRSDARTPEDKANPVLKLNNKFLIDNKTNGSNVRVKILDSKGKDNGNYIEFEEDGCGCFYISVGNDGSSNKASEFRFNLPYNDQGIPENNWNRYPQDDSPRPAFPSNDFDKSTGEKILGYAYHTPGYSPKASYASVPELVKAINLDMDEAIGGKLKMPHPKFSLVDELKKHQQQPVKQGDKK